MQTRDQHRALYAYECVQNVAKDKLNDYKVHVNSFGANLLKSGLAASICFLERDKADAFLRHLQAADIPGINPQADEKQPPTIGAQVRKLETEQYILASREARKIAIWFRRAVQAQGTE